MRRSLTLAGWAVSASLSWSVAHAEPAPSAPVESANTQDKVETVVFVGRLISIQEVPWESLPSTYKADPYSYWGLVKRDHVYNARYEILQMVSGQIDALEASVRIWSHYGFPIFALHPEALLFVRRRDADYTLHKYQGFSVHRTMGGGWAHCGDFEYRRPGEAAPAALRPLRFAEDFGPADQLATDERRRKFAEESFLVENDRIVCPRGLALADFYEAVRSGVMKSRGIDLPPFEDTATAR